MRWRRRQRASDGERERLLALSRHFPPSNVEVIEGHAPEPRRALVDDWRLALAIRDRWIESLRR